MQGRTAFGTAKRGVTPDPENLESFLIDDG